jgi:hypothetical protein
MATPCRTPMLESRALAGAAMIYGRCYLWNDLKISSLQRDASQIGCQKSASWFDFGFTFVWTLSTMV